MADNGTEELSGYDTYPVAIRSIRSGDMLLYKIQTSPGIFTRHTYLIKNVNANGTFDVLYSTQARRDAGLPMNRIAQYTFPNPLWAPNHTSPADRNRWGFKRFRTPAQMGAALTAIPDANSEQYALALQWGHQFFDHVKEMRTTTQETAQQQIDRMYDLICHDLHERVEIVTMGLAYREKTAHACMNASTYDIYSTPSRDGGILNSYKKLEQRARELKLSGVWNELSHDTRVNVEGVFDPTRDAETVQSIKKSCPFFAKEKLNTDLALFYEGLINGQVSHHPNDSLFNRWGIKTSTTAPLTTCPRY